MLLTLFTFLLNFLLFLQLFRNSGFTQRLVFWSFVRVAVECRLKRRVSAHTRNHVSPQLYTTRAQCQHMLQHYLISLLVGSTCGPPAVASCSYRDTGVPSSVVGPGTRYQTIFGIRHILLTVFVLI